MTPHATTAAPVAPRLCSIAAAADALSLSERTVAAHIAAGRLPSVKVGRRRLVVVAGLDEFVARLQGEREGAA